MLLHLYAVHALPIVASKTENDVAGRRSINGHADRRIRDAEEFELEGLISEDEEEAKRKINGRAG